jgi:hypothetical protein
MLQGQVVRDFGTSGVLSETPAYQGGWWDASSP